MRRLFSKIATLSVGLAMAIGVGVALSHQNVAGYKAEAAATDGVECVLWTSDYAASTNYTTSADGAIKWKVSSQNSYKNPTRIYAGEWFYIEIANNTIAKSINGVIINANSSSYATVAKNATWDVTGGGSVSKDVPSGSSTLTATTTGTVTKIIIKCSAQTRWNGVTVYYAPNKVLNSIEVSGTLVKSAYYDGQVFDPTGLTFTAHWSDGDVVLDETERAKIIWPALNIGDTSITGTYQGVEFTVSGISVSADTLSSIAVSGTLTKTTYYVGQTWNPAGLVATGTYVGKGEVDVTDKVEWSFNPATATSTAVDSVEFTASYGGQSGSKSYSVTVTEYDGYVRINSASDLNYGDEVLIGAHNQPIMMGSNATTKRNIASTTKMSEDHTMVDSYELESGVAKFVVTYGTVADTFAFADADGYLQMTSNSNDLKTVSTLTAGSDYVLVVEEGVMHVRNNTYKVDSEVGEIKYNSASGGMFRMYKVSNAMPSVDIYKKVGSSDLEAVRTFVLSKMKMDQYTDDNTYDKDRCDANYAAAKTAYNALSIAGKNLFNGSDEFANAKARLVKWAAANGEEFNAVDGTFTPFTKLAVNNYIGGSSANYAIIIIVATVSITALGLTLMIAKKKKHD